MDDTAAALQQEYDWAVHEHGPDSPQALEAERAAKQFFEKVSVAPVTPAFQD